MSYHHDVSRLSHVELRTPTPQESLDFFTGVLGLQVSHREGQSVWLRGWGEWWYVAQMPEPGSPRPRPAVEGEPALAQTFGPR